MNDEGGGELKSTITYFRSEVTPSDFKLLYRNSWFNDNVLGFALEYLHHDEFASDPRLGFLSPTAAFVLQYEDDADDFRESVVAKFGALPSPMIWVIPISDATRMQTSNGTHWSAMFANTATGQYVYVDSAARSHNSHRLALDLARKLDPLIVTRENGARFDPSLHFVRASVPQQNNTYDCGVFVVLYAKAVGEAVLQQAKTTLNSDGTWKQQQIDAKTDAPSDSHTRPETGDTGKSNYNKTASSLANIDGKSAAFRGAMECVTQECAAAARAWLRSALLRLQLDAP